MAPATRRAAQREPTGGPPTKNEQARLDADARAADRDRDKAYKAGRAAATERRRDRGALRMEHDEENRPYYDQGLGEARSDARRERVRSAATPPASVGQAADDGAGFLLGLVAWALALNYIRHGWPGVTGWLSAKFLNKPTLATSTVQGGVDTGPAPAGGGGGTGGRLA